MDRWKKKHPKFGQKLIELMNTLFFKTNFYVSFIYTPICRGLHHVCRGQPPTPVQLYTRMAQKGWKTSGYAYKVRKMRPNWSIFLRINYLKVPIYNPNSPLPRPHNIRPGDISRGRDIGQLCPPGDINQPKC